MPRSAAEASPPPSRRRKTVRASSKARREVRGWATARCSPVRRCTSPRVASTPGSAGKALTLSAAIARASARRRESQLGQLGEVASPRQVVEGALRRHPGRGGVVRAGCPGSAQLGIDPVDVDLLGRRHEGEQVELRVARPAPSGVVQHTEGDPRSVLAHPLWACSVPPREASGRRRGRRRSRRAEPTGHPAGPGPRPGSGQGRPASSPTTPPRAARVAAGRAGSRGGGRRRGARSPRRHTDGPRPPS